jgi:hypothetical protein
VVASQFTLRPPPAPCATGNEQRSRAKTGKFRIKRSTVALPVCAVAEEIGEGNVPKKRHVPGRHLAKHVLIHDITVDRRPDLKEEGPAAIGVGTGTKKIGQSGTHAWPT